CFFFCIVSNFKKRQAQVPITPMPHYSDMDTPDLKNKLNKFGVRPLPKRQMVLKLKEIHQYTHQLIRSDSEDEAPSAGQTSQAKVSSSASCRPANCAQPTFKLPTASPSKPSRDDEPLSASQGSNTSSTAESERYKSTSNPELVQLSDGDSDSDGGVSASQSASRLQDRLQAVRAFILSDSSLYNQILQYKPLVLSQLQQQLKAAGIRLGITKLADYLDSQCITFTTAKPGQSAPGRRRVKKTKTVGEGKVRRKKVTSAPH
uniref:Structure-specific endonuclease subunit SLX4 n=1 Tax=Neogobius melanostomus TaxID=47308 RepID=A0A8C6WWU9_9GOBI